MIFLCDDDDDADDADDEAVSKDSAEDLWGHAEQIWGRHCCWMVKSGDVGGGRKLGTWDIFGLHFEGNGRRSLTSCVGVITQWSLEESWVLWRFHFAVWKVTRPGEASSRMEAESLSTSKPMRLLVCPQLLKMF